MGPAGADRLKEPVTDLLINGEAGLKHRGGAAGIEERDEPAVAASFSVTSQKWALSNAVGSPR